MIDVLVTHEDIPHSGRQTSGGDELANHVQAAPRVEKKPAAARLVAPADEQARLTAPLVRGTARAQEPHTHP
jgi:hypothetical protein